MIADPQPYPAYKDSGVPWLGDIPEHWQSQRLRTVVEMRVSNVDKTNNDGEVPVRLCNYVDVYKNERITSRLQFMRATASPQEIENFHLQHGDVIITKDSETWNDIGVPSLVEYVAPDLVCGYHLALLRSLDSAVLSGPFLLRAIQSQGVATQLHVAANGVTRFGLSHSDIKSLRVPVPQSDEQTSIVRFLDHAERRIRRFIRVKQKLIKLLEEQKQSTIHRAVTRGLNPNAHLKPSGVEWLGDVPEHWKVLRVKQASQILRGKFTHRPRNDPALYDGPYPFIQTGEVARAGKAITTYRQSLNERGLAVSKSFPAGTLVMTIAANIGDVAVLDFEACFPDSIVGFVPGTDVERDFLYYLFRAMKPELLREAPVNTQGNLNIDRVGARGIALPPRLEQREITSYVEESTAGLASVIDRAQREIALVREYRTRLIAEVATGKLDVREAAANLPDEFEEPDELEFADETVEGGDGTERTDDELTEEEVVA